MVRGCLVVKVRDVGEGSLIISVVHPLLGKQEFLAKGGKGIRAKLTPSLQPLYLVNLWLAPTRSERAIIREVEVTKNFTPSYPMGLRVALRIVDMLNSAVYPLVECEELFAQSLAILNRVSTKQHELAQLKTYWITFELGLLEFLGVKPSLSEYQKNNASNLARFLEQKIHQFLG